MIDKFCEEKSQTVITIMREAGAASLKGQAFKNAVACRNKIVHRYYLWINQSVASIDSQYNFAAMMEAIEKVIQEIYNIYAEYPEQVNDAIAQEMAMEAAAESWRD